jgi:hypothetical protein
MFRSVVIGNRDMKQRKRMGMPTARTAAPRRNVAATTSSVPLGVEERVAAKERELLERASYQRESESTPERVVALLNRMGKTGTGSKPHSSETPKRPAL